MISKGRNLEVFLVLSLSLLHSSSVLLSTIWLFTVLSVHMNSQIPVNISPIVIRYFIGEVNILRLICFVLILTFTVVFIIPLRTATIINQLSSHYFRPSLISLIVLIFPTFRKIHCGLTFPALPFIHGHHLRYHIIKKFCDFISRIIESISVQTSENISHNLLTADLPLRLMNFSNDFTLTHATIFLAKALILICPL